MAWGAEFLTPMLATVQASLSVLLVISYGAISAHLRLLNATSTKAMSIICVRLFLPALLFVKIGSELHSGSASRYLVILIWAFIAHLVSFLIGVFAHMVFGMPDWITAAIMFNNTTSYPLLLVQSLEVTGILDLLILGDENTHDAIERAKSYFLVFSTVSSCLTFEVGPRLIDSEHAPETPDVEDEDEEDDRHREAEEREHEDIIPTVETPLISPNQPQPQPQSQPRPSTISFLPFSKKLSSIPKPIHLQRRPSTAVISKHRWHTLNDRARWWLLFLYDFLNAPLIGAMLGAIVGLIPVLHRAFFAPTNSGGVFTAWLTASLSNIGNLFIPLPVIIAGVSLYLSSQHPRSERVEAETPWLTTIFVLLIRFMIWPVISVGIIYTVASRTYILGDDPMLWFAMMLMPTGPPAMKLITMAEVSDADDEDEHRIAKLLTISYIISPILAFTVVGSLKASQAAIR